MTRIVKGKSAVGSLVGRTFGKYEIRRLLGKGGMGDVYEAYDADKGRIVALKLLKEQYAQDGAFRARFLRESRAAAVLQEPHVIPIHDWGEIEGILYIDMRLVQGETLHDRLKRQPLDPEDAVAITQQIAAALDAAHAQGLIHRDVKPQNILVTPDDFAYLVDFGIAETTGETHLTIVGYRIGSYDYMAPERFGDGEATSAVDVYALACVLYEALTGAKPFAVHSAEKIIGAHLAAPPPRPSAVDPRIPPELDDVVARGMAKHPDDRYGSAGALGRAAKRALSARPSPSQPETFLAPQHFHAAPSYPPFHVQYPPPPTGPNIIVADDGKRTGQIVAIAAAVVAAALVVGGIGLAIGVLANRNSNSQSSTTPLVPYSSPFSSTAAETTAESSTQPGGSTTSQSPVPRDPLAQLRQIAADDSQFVAVNLADRWVPQLSSKRPGVVDNGVVWDNAMTLQEHLRLRNQYPGVRLLWSGDWSTFSAPDFWVTVAGMTFPTSAGALTWCRSQGFDRDHCAAKIVSTTHPVDGSTAYN